MISVKKNLCRLGVLSSSLLLLTAATTPSVIAFADIQTSAIKNNTDDADGMYFVQSYEMSVEDKELLVRNVKANHPTVSEDFIREVIERQLVGDYTLPEEETLFRSAWQGVTVDQLGAALDVAIGMALTGGAGSIAAGVLRVGKREAVGRVKSILIKYGLGKMIAEIPVDYMLNLLSPGYHIARY
ncbi:TPA: hypothetical protein TVE62_001873, partial [Streptococcus equi subsp. zooepidemicus]|nr:hypothetical protein [Streptococcus equi subsp. equi]HEL1053021.1 hypothetical protein [Streptococcus equi subsp. zooepidemicus]HEK9686509.1 hypothetical protein [Streptococcus equi subsp. equi]HEL1194814.1 hypothetical protein [Streptococcus equi subsp. zooepidemicus]HEL1362216.1 hypothetical protein [Streptococcus equi subsp. equi]